jgi:magnesium-transporting ATPase (P-type)
MSHEPDRIFKYNNTAMFLQLFGLIALIVKIILLSTLYSSLIFAVLFLLSKKKKIPWLEKRMKRKLRNWLLLHFLISVSLFLFSFSYWQNTGLGENPQLPIGYGQVIYGPDFAWTTFYPDLEKTAPNQDGLQIENFIVQNGMLCAEVAQHVSNSLPYNFIVCDLRARTDTTFLSEADYAEYATAKGLPMKKEFYDFKKHFQEYFDKQPVWKRWLLP